MIISGGTFQKAAEAPAWGDDEGGEAAVPPQCHSPTLHHYLIFAHERLHVHSAAVCL